MYRRALILVLSLGLTACGTLPSPMALFRRAPAPAATQQVILETRPADGLWVALDPGCDKPADADFRAWPACASPFWINQDIAVVVRATSRARGVPVQQSYRAGLVVTGGEPMIVQVGSPDDGYIFLALTEVTRATDGRLVAAAGAPVVCNRSLLDRITFRANVSGCEAQSAEEVRRAATVALADREGLMRVAWIATGAPAVQ